MQSVESRLRTAQRRLELYYRAEEAILKGQEYTMGTKRLRRADLSDVQAMIKTLEKEVASLSQGGKNKVLRAVPMDI